MEPEVIFLTTSHVWEAMTRHTARRTWRPTKNESVPVEPRSASSSLDPESRKSALVLRCQRASPLTRLKRHNVSNPVLGLLVQEKLVFAKARGDVKGLNIATRDHHGSAVQIPFLELGGTNSAPRPNRIVARGCLRQPPVVVRDHKRFSQSGFHQEHDAEHSHPRLLLGPGKQLRFRVQVGQVDPLSDPSPRVGHDAQTFLEDRGHDGNVRSVPQEAPF
mmetsp:Transcript_10433/g.21972  ORF Transcript_10433/g.21972 Transcript_10433/m.21972 type:complete len:219 (+) Transcript_10433:281-937(+)